MPTLLLMRHAKSSWDSNVADDHARPLNARGREAARTIARALGDAGMAPDAVVGSDAVRTRQTWAEMAPLLPAPRDVRWTRSLYLAGLPALLDAAGEWPVGWGRVLCLGHNPGWEEAASALARAPLTLTTGNVAVLDGVDAPWAEALRGRWRLLRLLRPRELGDRTDP